MNVENFKKIKMRFPHNLIHIDMITYFVLNVNYKINMLFRI